MAFDERECGKLSHLGWPGRGQLNIHDKERVLIVLFGVSMEVFLARLQTGMNENHFFCFQCG